MVATEEPIAQDKAVRLDFGQESFDEKIRIVENVAGT